MEHFYGGEPTGFDPLVAVLNWQREARPVSRLGASPSGYAALVRRTHQEITDATNEDHGRDGP